MFRSLIAKIFGTGSRRPIRLARRTRLNAELLDAREVPAVVYWNPVGGSTDATVDGNWHVEGDIVRRVPGADDDVRFEFVRAGANADCDGFGAAGFYKSVSLFGVYTSTVTLSHGFSTFDFNLHDGKISQPVSGTDILTKNFYWNGGELNSCTTNSQKLTVQGGTATIAPGGGTLTTRDTIVFVAGAVGATATFHPGTVAFAGGDGVEVNADCSVVIAADTDNIQFSKTNAGQEDKKVWIKTGGTVTVPGPKDFNNAGGIYLLNEGGTFILKGGAWAVFQGTVGPQGQTASVRQTDGILAIENGSTLLAEKGAYLSGGKLSTMAKTTAGDPSRIATILVGTGTNLTVAGANVEIGDPAYDPAGAGHTFSTLQVGGNVVWTSGAARFSVGWNDQGVLSNDVWRAEGTFTMTGGANGAKLGPRQPVNVGTNTLSGRFWYIISGLQGTTINVNPQKLNFENAAQENDWTNIVDTTGPTEYLKLTHK